MTEPNWIDIMTVDSRYEQQLDANSRHGQTRYRLRSYSLEDECPWTLGAPPQDVAPTHADDTAS